MGLDMQLTRKVYIGAPYEHNNVKGTIYLTKGKENKEIKINFSKLSSIEEEVMDWRKANQIHGWFVNNVQDGIDDCKEYYVSHQQLKSLRDLCKQVVDNKDKAEELLPNTEGFFFGSQNYDEYYFADIQLTYLNLDSQIHSDEFEESSYYYSSSW